MTGFQTSYVHAKSYFKICRNSRIEISQANVSLTADVKYEGLSISSTAFLWLLTCVFLSGPICRTLRTSPAASTMKCIAWGASMRITQWWLMPTVSQNIILLPMRCRRHLPHCSWPQQGVIHLLWDFDRHWQSSHRSSSPLHPSSSHRWGRNLKACQRDFIFSDFRGLNGLFTSVYCLINKHYPLTIADKDSEEKFDSL